MIFIFTVIFISSIIIFYCWEYIYTDLYKDRFFFLLFFFILSIIFIIISPNILRILLGWDGLGLISYCLVIYYQRYFSFNCGILTLLINRVGDVIIIVSIIFIFNKGRWRFIFINKIRLVILFFIIIASFTKSAQFPFSSWLPAAIAAPTPVSSLVHSSTLVTAGVYLLIRFNYLIKDNIIIKFILIFGLLTILIAGFSAIFEYDIKKIIAFSTLSQLGLMIIILAVKNYELSYFHLVIHAIFKSIIFICSGVIIHRILNYQDIRYLGNLKKFIPLTLSLLLVANLSLCGLPFISGFYSKDQILEKLMLLKLNLVVYIFLILSISLTVLYRIRITYFLIKRDFSFFIIYIIKDSKLINFSIIFLIFISLYFGFFMNWVLFINIELIFIDNLEKVLILIKCFFSLIIINSLIDKNYFLKKKIFSYFFGKIYFNYLINNKNIKMFLIFGNFYIKLNDKGWNNVLINCLFLSLIKKFYLEMDNYVVILKLTFIILLIIILIIY